MPHSPASPSPASPARIELPEEIARAIEAFDREVRWSEEYGSCRDLSVRSSRQALTTAILSRLTAAEAGREEALRERDDARCVGEANARAADANLAAAEAAEADRDAALARVERLEKALRFTDGIVTAFMDWLVGEHNDITPPLPLALAMIDAQQQRHAALSEAPSQGD